MRFSSAFLLLLSTAFEASTLVSASERVAVDLEVQASSIEPPCPQPPAGSDDAANGTCHSNVAPESNQTEPVEDDEEAQSTPNPPGPPPQAIALDLATGNWKAQATRSFVVSGMAAAMEELGAFQEKGVFVQATEIATKAKLHPKATYRLLRYLSSIMSGSSAICVESLDQPGAFTLGPVGQVLTPNHPGSVAKAVLWEASLTSALTWNNLPQFLETNEMVVPEALGEPNLWSYFAKNPDVLATFSGAMTGHSNEQAFFLSNPALSPTFDLSSFKTICDLGCAEGRTSLAVSERFPQAKYILADLPEVVDRIDRKALPNNFSVSKANFLTGTGKLPKADAYLMKFIFHDWSDADSAKILANIRKKSPKATIFVMEFGPMPGANQPHLAKGFDLHMGVFFASMERTQEEYDALWSNNGYERVATHFLAGGEYPLYIQEVKPVGV